MISGSLVLLFEGKFQRKSLKYILDLFLLKQYYKFCSNAKSQHISKKIKKGKLYFTKFPELCNVSLFVSLEELLLIERSKWNGGLRLKCLRKFNFQELFFGIFSRIWWSDQSNFVKDIWKSWSCNLSHLRLILSKVSDQNPRNRF